MGVSQVMPAPDLSSLLFSWSGDEIALFLLVTAGTGAIAVWRGAQLRGARISRLRWLALAAALAIAGYATLGGLARYDTALFSAHAVQHLLLGMAAPLLFALAAPVTLLLQASGRATRSRLLALLHGRGARVLAHPATAWVLFVPALYALYFSPLYELTLRNDLAHALLHAHLFAAGFLFFGHVVGADPFPRLLAPPARVLFAATVIPLHSFLGLAVVSSESLLGGTPPTIVSGIDLVADQRIGAVLMWIGGEVVVAAALALAVRAWMRDDAREARREDRLVSVS